MVIDDRRIKRGVERGKQFAMQIDGEDIPAFEGETIATALLAAGKKTCRKTSKGKQTRGIYCGIGICYECRMIVNGRPNTRICQTLATPGCKVQTQYVDLQERI